MKYRLFSALQQSMDFPLWLLAVAAIPFRAIRVWAWTRATRENLRTCLTRPVNTRLS